MELLELTRQLGIEDYISLVGVSNTRKAINAKLYYHLLTTYPNETNVREYLVADGPDTEWLKGITNVVMPFLRRHANG